MQTKVRITYIKNFLTGVRRGARHKTYTDISDRTSVDDFKRILAEVSPLHPAIDPETGILCYVSNIEEELFDVVEQKSA